MPPQKKSRKNEASSPAATGPVEKRASDARNREAKKSGKKAAPTTKTKSTTKIKNQIAALDREILEAIGKRRALILELNQDSEKPVRYVESSLPRNSTIASEDASKLMHQIDSYCQSKSGEFQVCFLGPLYSYSYLAAARYFGEFEELIPVNSIAAVFGQVAEGQSDFGVVPIENSTDGRIADTLTMFAQHPVSIFREIHLPIQHCLIGTGKIKDIREIRSKSQAISQCRNWLDRTFSPKIQRVPTNSSSDAALDAKRMGKEVAAIASREAANGLGLNVISPDIEDQKGNVTRFAVIVRPDNPKLKLPGKTGKDKTSIMFGIPHRPGALADVINIFKRAKLNLTWIESFPKPGAFSEYTFFAEFQGHRQEAKVKKALTSLEKKTEQLTWLGSYPEFESES